MESECHEIIKYELDGLRSFRETSVPGHPKIHLQRGQSICMHLKLFSLSYSYACLNI